MPSPKGTVVASGCVPVSRAVLSYLLVLLDVIIRFGYNPQSLVSKVHRTLREREMQGHMRPGTIGRVQVQPEPLTKLEKSNLTIWSQDFSIANVDRVDL